MSRPRILYRAPDHPEPSWGVGLLYRHVELLRRAGFEAWVLHGRAGFALPWLESTAPVTALDREPVRDDDVVVVPEVLAAREAGLAGRRIVFVQGPFLVPRGLEGARDYAELGYEAALAILPGIARIVERHFGISAVEIPPFVDDAFFAPDSGKRDRRVLLAAKPEFERWGFPDREIVERLVRPALVGGRELVRLAGLRHAEVAALMARSDLLVNLNSLEGLNTTVVEAMAAGCLVLCYDGVGPRDYLEPDRNAFVCPNHDSFALAERAVELVARLDAGDPALDAVRSAGRRTAARFRREHTAAALSAFFARFLPR